jgi:hypothetical protein
LLHLWLDAVFLRVLLDLFLFIGVRSPVALRRHHLLDLDSGFLLALGAADLLFPLYLFSHFYFHGALIWRCQIWFAGLYFALLSDFYGFFYCSHFLPLCTVHHHNCSHAWLSICFSPSCVALGAFPCLDEPQAHTNPPLLGALISDEKQRNRGGDSAVGLRLDAGEAGS